MLLFPALLLQQTFVLLAYMPQGSALRTVTSVRGGLIELSELDVAKAAERLRAAAAVFGLAQRDAADAWLARCLAGEGFDPAQLLEQKINLFEECEVNDDGSSNCQALGETLIDLQDAMSYKVPTDRQVSSEERWKLNKLAKAALQVRNSAAQLGPKQKQQANAWLERALRGENSASLFEESFELFGGCQLDDVSSTGHSKCVELSNALDALRVTLNIEDE